MRNFFSILGGISKIADLTDGGILSVATGANPAPNTAYAVYDLYDLAGAAAFQVPTGTLTDGKKILIRIKDMGISL